MFLHKLHFLKIDYRKDLLSFICKSVNDINFLLISIYIFSTLSWFSYLKVTKMQMNLEIYLKIWEIYIIENKNLLEFLNSDSKRILNHKLFDLYERKWDKVISVRNQWHNDGCVGSLSIIFSFTTHFLISMSNASLK